MKREASCCKTLFLNAVKRSWPIWTAYLIVWLIALCGSVGSDLNYCLNYHVSNYSAAVRTVNIDVINIAAGWGVFISFFAAIASAMRVFSFMYTSRSVSAAASLPVTRGKLYLVQTAAGLVPLLAANILVCAAALCVEAGFGMAAPLPLLEWLALTSMQLVIFFGTAALCAQLTGHIVVLPAVYLVLSLTAYVLEAVVCRAVRLFVYGASASGGTLTVLSPVVHLLNMYVDTPGYYDADGVWCVLYEQARFSDWTCMLLYFAAGLVLIFLGMLLYRHRRMESAGDVVAVRVLKPVFKYCFALGGALVLGVATNDILVSGTYTDGSVWLLLVLMLAGGFICYFVAEMLIKKTFHVWKARAFAGFGAFAVIFSALVCAMEFDAFGYERSVPDAESIASVYITGSGDGIILKEPENIESALALHRAVISHKAENEDSITDGTSLIITLRLNYELENGKTVTRVYNICSPAEDIDRYEALLNCQEAINYRKEIPEKAENGSISYAEVSYCSGTDEYGYEQRTVLCLTAEEALELYTQCIKPDVADGTLGRIWLVLDEDYYSTVYDCSISIEFRASNGGDTSYYGFYTVPTTESLRTSRWLTEHGVVLRLNDTDEKLVDYAVTTESAQVQVIIN